MAKMEKQKEIISITHFINPHLFWYHKINIYNDEYRTILEIEKELAEYYTGHQAWTQALRHPPLKAKVAVKFLAWNKLIRARVDHIASFGKNVTGGEFIMWAIDYGFPFQTKCDHIYRLPEKLTKPVDYIRCGGLANILPAEHFFMKDAMVKNVSKKWHQRACDVVEKAINDSESILFIKEFNINGQDWGELIVKTNMGVKYRVKDHLISLHLALDAESKFRNEYQKLETIKILPWMCNNGNSKFHTNRAYIYPAVVGISHNGTKSPASECNVTAKLKVEEWYERNEFTSENDAGAFLDTTSEYTMTEGSITDAMSNRKCDHQIMDLTKIDESDESQHMQLAGVLSKSRIERYSNGKLPTPPPPSTVDFQLKADENTKANETIETSESEISAIKYERLEDSSVHNIDSKQPAQSFIKSTSDQSKKKVENNKAFREIEEIGHIEDKTALNSAGSGLFVQYLITLRNEYIEGKTNDEVSNKTLSEYASEDLTPKQTNNFNLPTLTKNDNKHEPTDLVNTTFYGLRMIPAGYDIMNLHDYRDEDHWHCKKSTLNDRVPHKDIDLTDYAK